MTEYESPAEFVDAESARVDAIILGAGISGLVAARLLKRLGYRKIVMLDSHHQIGGNHISVHLGPYTFDIGTFLFQDDSPLIRHFPELLAAYHPARPSTNRVAPDGRIQDYPMSPKAEIVQAGITECVRIVCSLLWARLSLRKRRNAQDFVRFWLGSRLAQISGIENYIIRFYGVPAAEIDIIFAEKRMGWIANAASLRKQVMKLLGKKDPWLGSQSFVRPRAGFSSLYKVALDSLEADDVHFRLGETFQTITRDGDELCLTTAAGTLRTGTLISTIPVDHCLKLCGLTTGSSLPTITLTTLFFSFKGHRGFTTTILYNFTSMGTWKRLTMYSDYYGLADEREYCGVEINQPNGLGQNSGNDKEVEQFCADFILDMQNKGLLRGDLKLEGAYRLENAYPVYVHGASALADIAIAALRKFGIQSIGRQGGFDYLPTARHTTLVVEEALLGRRGPLDASPDEGS
jgi:protoporphyrinogen oxidase